MRLLGVLDSHHLPHKGCQRSTQKIEQQRQKRRQVAATTLAKLLSYSDLGRAQNAVLTESVPLRATWAPNLSGLDRGGARSLGPASDGSQLSIVEPQRFVHREKGQVQQGWDTVCTRQCYLFAASPPPLHSATELVSLKNQQTEEVKQREPPWKWSHTAHNIREGPVIFLLFLKSFLFFLFFSFSNFFFNC